MHLLVGLGNPGEEYSDTRHNIGFRVVDGLADRLGLSFSDRKFKARLARGTLEGQPCLFMKPQGFMNLSGESVGPCAGFFQISTTNIVVFHDELDLPLGRIQIKKGGGHGGHNGVRSLMRHLPDGEFVRIRLGVGRPPAGWDGADYVLGRFRSDEWEAVGRMVDRASDAVTQVLRDGVSRAMNVFNRVQPVEDDEGS
ncbi:MAG: aminoacyl-tRNA hydrolase [Deltaproteobacteria bacterium]|nr:aminoacyl-tRNA hydrolase [Deltaproteobacteria bacterium]